jgi:hypothetical protein
MSVTRTKLSLDSAAAEQSLARWLPHDMFESQDCDKMRNADGHR